MKFALCIPTINPGRSLDRLLALIRQQSMQPDEFLVVDSGSTDGTAERCESFGARVLRIPCEEFDHGRTRQLAVEHVPATEIVMFLTQDAFPAATTSFQRLLAAFDDVLVAAAYGRQLPRHGASLIESHARLYNYPPISGIKTFADAAILGIKTAFISNSFSAYRRTALMDCGGFPQQVILGEDTLVAARMLLKGLKIAYCADAPVYHSHPYSPVEEFRRYFDTGVMHARERWIGTEFGGASGEGLRFVLSELRFLARKSPIGIPEAMGRSVLKLLAYRLGRLERSIPAKIKRRWSMNARFWGQS